jgi:thioredoxin 1
MNPMTLAIGIVAIVLLTGGYFVVRPGGEEEAMKEVMVEQAKTPTIPEEVTETAMDGKEMMETKDAMTDKPAGEMMKEDAMMKKEDTSMMKKDEGEAMETGAMMKKAGSYVAYAPEKLSMANTGDVVLFFRASWCPSCKTLDANIKANMTGIPEGLTILDVNYDTATDLKKKYGVTYQHTLVQVSADGTLIKKWSGSPTLADIVSKVE